MDTTKSHRSKDNMIISSRYTDCPSDLKNDKTSAQTMETSPKFADFRSSSKFRDYSICYHPII